jgi:hypothetical protein
MPALPATRRTSLLALGAAGVVGLLIGLQALTPEFINGTGGKWVRPENDYNAYLVAWHYYVSDTWRLPLFSLPAMGYPEGGSVLFNDGLPLTALPSKVIYQLTGVLINPFGWWILLTYVLQGVMAAKVMLSVGVRSVAASAAAATLAVVATSFVARMGHTALSSHFLLLWAISVYFSSLRQHRAKPAECTALLAVTLLTNAYLFAMVFSVVVVTAAALWVRRQLDIRAAGYLALGMVAVAVLGVAAGYGLVISNPTTMKSEGFGRFSWNLVSLLVPPQGFFGIASNITRDATHGQYEGEAYIGMGALLLLVVATASAPKAVLASVRHHWTLCALLVVFAVYAASNLVYAGSVLLISYDLPAAALSLGNYFRATGRFIWPLAYSLTLLPLAWLFRSWPRLPAVGLALAAAWLQFSEARPGIQYRRELTKQSYEDLIHEHTFRPWLADHQRLWQYPSWDCGGLVGHNRGWPSQDSNRELQLQLAAAELAVPTNSVYMSRALKNCAREADWEKDPHLEAGTLYVLGPSTVDSSPRLSALAASAACTRLDWAIVCSSSWRVASPR